MSGHVCAEDEKQPMRVLYNGACPVCSFEIGLYRGRAARDGLALGFDDLNDRAALSRWGLDADEAARRLHVRRDGRTLTGMDAVRARWSEMPGMRWAARASAWPGLRGGLDWLYDRVGAPLLYRSHLKRAARAGGRS